MVSSINDYDFALLPCNTAYTGNISSSRLVDKEDNQTLILENANVIAARQNDYLEDSVYKKKIDVLTEAMLSKEVREYIQKKYEGKITCDEKTQIDLRK